MKISIILLLALVFCDTCYGQNESKIPERYKMLYHGEIVDYRTLPIKLRKMICQTRSGWVTRVKEQYPERMSSIISNGLAARGNAVRTYDNQSIISDINFNIAAGAYQRSLLPGPRYVYGFGAGALVPGNYNVGGSYFPNTNGNWWNGNLYPYYIPYTEQLKITGR